MWTSTDALSHLFGPSNPRNCSSGLGMETDWWIGLRERNILREWSLSMASPTHISHPFSSILHTELILIHEMGNLYINNQTIWLFTIALQCKQNINKWPNNQNFHSYVLPSAMSFWSQKINIYVVQLILCLGFLVYVYFITLGIDLNLVYNPRSYSLYIYTRISKYILILQQYINIKINN